MRGMTVTNPELETAERKTIEGMAFWSGTGPPKATCGKCMNYGYTDDDVSKPHGCALYFKQMHRHAPRAIPETTAACKYFERLSGR